MTLVNDMYEKWLTDSQIHPAHGTLKIEDWFDFARGAGFTPEEMESAWRGADYRNFNESKAKEFKPEMQGKTVTILEGPYAGKTGTVTSVEIFGDSLMVNIDGEDVDVEDGNYSISNEGWKPKEFRAGENISIETFTGKCPECGEYYEDSVEDHCTACGSSLDKDDNVSEEASENDYTAQCLSCNQYGKKSEMTYYDAERVTYEDGSIRNFPSGYVHNFHDGSGVTGEDMEGVVRQVSSEPIYEASQIGVHPDEIGQLRNPDGSYANRDTYDNYKAVHGFNDATEDYFEDADGNVSSVMKYKLVYMNGMDYGFQTNSKKEADDTVDEWNSVFRGEPIKVVSQEVGNWQDDMSGQWWQDTINGEIIDAMKYMSNPADYEEIYERLVFGIGLSYDEAMYWMRQNPNSAKVLELAGEGLEEDISYLNPDQCIKCGEDAYWHTPEGSVSWNSHKYIPKSDIIGESGLYGYGSATGRMSPAESWNQMYLGADVFTGKRKVDMSLFREFEGLKWNELPADIQELWKSAGDYMPSGEANENWRKVAEDILDDQQKKSKKRSGEGYMKDLGYAECDICGERFDDASGFASHDMQVHEEREHGKDKSNEEYGGQADIDKYIANIPEIDPTGATSLKSETDFIFPDDWDQDKIDQEARYRLTDDLDWVSGNAYRNKTTPWQDGYESYANEEGTSDGAKKGWLTRKGSGMNSISDNLKQKIKQDAMANQDIYGLSNFDPDVHMDGDLLDELKSAGVSDDDIYDFTQTISTDPTKEGDFVKSQKGLFESYANETNEAFLYELNSIMSDLNNGDKSSAVKQFELLGGDYIWARDFASIDEIKQQIQMEIDNVKDEIAKREFNSGFEGGAGSGPQKEYTDRDDFGNYMDKDADFGNPEWKDDENQYPSTTNYNDPEKSRIFSEAKVKELNKDGFFFSVIDEDVDGYYNVLVGSNNASINSASAGFIDGEVVKNLEQEFLLDPQGLIDIMNSSAYEVSAKEFYGKCKGCGQTKDINSIDWEGLSGNYCEDCYYDKVGFPDDGEQ